MRRYLSNTILAIVIISLFSSFFASSGVAISQGEITAKGATSGTVLWNHGPIWIDSESELSDLIMTNNWNGTGTADDPFLIENLSINAPTHNNAIFISNITTSYLKITNCTLVSTLALVNGHTNATILLNNTQHCIVDNNICTGYNGIFLARSSTYNTVSNNTIVLDHNTGYDGIFLSASGYNLVSDNFCKGGYHCINVESSNHNLIKNNSMETSRRCGLVLVSSNNNLVTNNTINNTGNNGLRLTGSYYNTVSYNNLSKNSAGGIYIFQTSRFNTVTHNNCSNGNSYGIYVAQSNDNYISNNTCDRNNYYGFYLSSASYNTIDHNICKNNIKFAVYATSSNGNHLYGNLFITNNGAGSAYSASHPQGSDNGLNFYNGTAYGNYWSDWSVPDDNMDGIVDSALAIGASGSSDQFPLAISVKIASPANDYYTTGTSVSLSGSASAHFGISAISWYNAKSLGTGVCTGTSSWSATVPLQIGYNNITVTVEDQQGLAYGKNVTVIRYSGGPSITIDSPVEGAYVNSNSVQVSWTASAATGISKAEVSSDGTSWTTATGSTYTLTLTDGQYTIHVRVTDGASNTNEDTVSIVVDTALPSVTITSPIGGSYVPGNVTVRWTAIDVGSSIVKTEIKVDAGSWATVTGTNKSLVLDNGTHTVTVKVTDAAGNTKEGAITFIVDAAKPTLAITAPVSGEWYNGSALNATWTASDSKSGTAYYWYSLDGASWVNITAKYVVLTGLDQNGHVLKVRAYDSVGNFNESQVAFSIDKLTPSVVITAPTTSEVFNSTSIHVVWSANAASGIEKCWVKLGTGAWTEATGSDHTFSGLTDGPYTVRVKVMNNVGAINETEVTFTVDIIAPSVILYAPGGESALVNTSGTPMMIEFSEAMNRSSVVVMLGSDVVTGTWTNDVTLTGILALHYNTSYTVNVAGKDLAGNQLTYSWTMTTMKDEGAIIGMIKDANGNALVGATVTLSNGMTTHTNATGYFQFLNVASGAYTITISKEGYTTVTKDVASIAGQESGVGTLSVPTSSPGTDWTVIAIIAAIVVVGIGAGFVIWSRAKK